jgi:hypothetical protein
MILPGIGFGIWLVSLKEFLTTHDERDLLGHYTTRAAEAPRCESILKLSARALVGDRQAGFLFGPCLNYSQELAWLFCGRADWLRQS